MRLAWAIAIFVLGIGSISLAVNIIATVISCRAPGMTMRRLPLFTWINFVNAFIIIFALPVLNAGLAMLLILAGLVLYRRKRLQRISLILAILLLWAFSNRWVAMALARSLEWRYRPPPDLPQADVIVVLGGATSSQEPPRPLVEVNGAGDRVIYAAYLYKQGVAPYLLLSGGNIDWLGEHTGTPAQDMARLLELMGVPASALWMQPDSRNTYEDAVYCKQILDEKGIHRIVLVTSRYHMPRSVAEFHPRAWSGTTWTRSGSSATASRGPRGSRGGSSPSGTCS